MSLTGSRYDVLIVGSGHAGAHCAITLRQRGFPGTIAIATDEQDPHYERPPLSKDYLAGEKNFDRILIRQASFWGERAVDLLHGQRVVQLDPASRIATTAAGARIGYGSLIWAAGGSPRRLACGGEDLKGIHAIRSRADVDRLKAELPHVAQVLVIGAGYIGLEAAAVLTRLGKQVIVVEALDRVLARVAGEPLSRFYEAEHRAHGVDLRLSTSVACLVGAEGRVTGAQLTGGERLAADAVIVGIGIVPEVAPLLAAGAEGGNGVDVDAYCRTSLPDVYAIGDCAAHENRFAAGGRIRVESVQNAHDQASIVAKALAGEAEPYAAVPWFWSNQYDLRLQTVGIAQGHDTALLRGDPAARSFSVVYLREGRVIALDCVNATRDYVQGRALVIAGASPDPDALADPKVPLKELAASKPVSR